MCRLFFILTLMKISQPADFIQTDIPVDSIEVNKMISLEIEGQSIILTRWQGKIYAFSGRCPHAAADLSQGELYKGRIDCADHGWRFDIRTGRALYPPDEMCRLKRFQLLEIDGFVHIKL